MAESYKLTYFNLKAVAEPIRMIFAYAGVSYEDKRIEYAEWPQHKAEYPWGQLPVLEIGDRTLCQSNAISRYLARKFNLAGETEWEAAKMDEIADVMGDLRTEYRKPHLEQDEAKKVEMKKVVLDTVLPNYFSKFEALAAANEGPYIVGKKLSWMDIQLAHFHDFFTKQEPTINWDAYPNLQKLKEAVFEEPQIKAHIETRPDTHF